MSSTKNENKYAAPALDKGLDILEYLSRVGTPQSQVDIAEALERSTTEIYRMLSRLEIRGYIIRDGASGKYRLSLKLYHLSHTHSPIESLRGSAIEAMKELSDKVGHAAHLSILDDNALMVVCQTRSASPVSLSIAEGSRFPLVNTTSGKILLSSVSENERSKILDQDSLYQSWSKKDRSSYLKELETIRERGYHYDDSKVTHGVTDISVRVGVPEGPILATVAISYVSSTMGDSKTDHDELIKATQEAAEKIASTNGLS
ncbi:IclR family transcriptional regulator [Pelagicoccus mobilis]|uniref:IclR family transcriptional regulator n=1 Tax=Pelagicoccus mobilis TaxID=415221 RepID=A0A934S7B3_9BACT|nr:IclR family transcriptional regulator [Pelagicoccus mobilis]MBK1880233.1 IclR family transcriptional regulator [Pelagicoccus mobilis]